MNTFLRFYSKYCLLLGKLAVIAGLATFAMVLLVNANVFGRKFLNFPVMGSVEISQALLTISVMLGLPIAQVNGVHLRVTVISGFFPFQIRRLFFAFAALAGCMIFGLLAWTSMFEALRSWNVGEQVWGAAVRFPLWPVRGVLCIAAALLSLQFLLDAIRVGWFGQIETRDEILAQIVKNVETDNEH